MKTCLWDYAGQLLQTWQVCLRSDNAHWIASGRRCRCLSGQFLYVHGSRFWKDILWLFYLQRSRMWVVHSGSLGQLVSTFKDNNSVYVGLRRVWCLGNKDVWSCVWAFGQPSILLTFLAHFPRLGSSKCLFGIACLLSSHATHPFRASFGRFGLVPRAFGVVIWRPLCEATFSWEIDRLTDRQADRQQVDVR